MCNEHGFTESYEPPALWDELHGNTTAEPQQDNGNDSQEPDDHHLVSVSATNNVCGFPIWKSFVAEAIIQTLGELTIDDLDDYDIEQAFVDGATIREAAASIFANDGLASITVAQADIMARFGVDKLFIYG